MKQKRLDSLWKILLPVLLGYIFLVSASCRQTVTEKPETDTDAILRVWFFHPTNRCESCEAIEENTKKILGEHFKDQLENGIIRFRSFNIDNRENKTITEKYQISYTSLLLIRADGTITDFTNNSMNYASMNPDKFEALLISEIYKNLE